ncbi:MAG: four helix bundle protein [Chitinophagaceae bacterium]|nr:four helix bundle protein [Chitinophagaceae bacterium]
MFLQLAHTRLNVFQYSKSLALECYRITKLFPQEERFAISQQIRRAGLSVYLNIAEGASRKSLAERKRYFEIARGSVIEADAAIGMSFELHYVNLQQLKPLEQLILQSFKTLTGLINHTS